MKQFFVRIGILVTAVVGMVACSKNDNDQPGPTHMRWVNVVPNLSFDIYSNGTLIVPKLPFDSLTSYASGLPSFYNLQIAKYGTSDTLVNGRQQLQSGLYYSMFLLPDTTGGQINANKVTIATVTENTFAPSVDTCKIRFFNFAPYTPPIDVVISKDGRTRPSDTLRPFSRRIYNDQSVSSSYTTYYQMFASNLKINLYNDIDSSLIRTIPWTFDSRGVYTIYLKPVPGKSGKDTFDFSVLKSTTGIQL